MLKRAYTYASPLLHRLIRLARIEQAACDDSVLEIRGWAIWLGSASPRLVRIYLNDTLVGETRLNRSRPDLWWRYIKHHMFLRCGFRFRCVVQPPEHAGGPAGPALRLEFVDRRGARFQRHARITYRTLGTGDRPAATADFEQFLGECRTRLE